MKAFKIYDERTPEAKTAKVYELEAEAIADFIEFNATHNTSFDGMDNEQIESEITLHEIAFEYFGSWGRVKEL